MLQLVRLSVALGGIDSESSTTGSDRRLTGILGMEKQNHPTAAVRCERNRPTVNLSTLNFSSADLSKINLCSKLANMTSDSPEIHQFLSESEFFGKQGASRIDTLVQLLQDITEGAILGDDIFTRMKFSLMSKARQFGLHRFPQASLVTCRLQKEISQALAETGCLNHLQCGSSFHPNSRSVFLGCLPG